VTDEEVLRGALDWFGESGECWLKGNLVQTWSSGNVPVKACMEGSVRLFMWGEMTQPMRGPERERYDRICDLLVHVAVEQFPDLRDEHGEPVVSVPEFNDADQVTFADVRVVFEKAIAEAAERAGNRD
jgi:hypothetical protein